MWMVCTWLTMMVSYGTSIQWKNISCPQNIPFTWWVHGHINSHWPQPLNNITICHYFHQGVVWHIYRKEPHWQVKASKVLLIKEDFFLIYWIFLKLCDRKNEEFINQVYNSTSYQCSCQAWFSNDCFYFQIFDNVD